MTTNNKGNEAISNFLSLEPDSVLEFRRPFTQGIVKQTLKVINNLSNSGIAFKVKTTAPKQYCVRPNSGRIPPKGSIDVQVLLQMMKEDPPLDMKCKDKFLVQAIRISDEVLELDQEIFGAKLSELWVDAERVKKCDPDGGGSEVMAEKKLRCSYEPPLTGGGIVVGASGALASASPPSADTSNSSNNQPSSSSRNPSPDSSSLTTSNTANNSPPQNERKLSESPAKDQSPSASQNQSVGITTRSDSNQSSPDNKLQQKPTQQPSQSSNENKSAVGGGISSDLAEKELREAREQVKRLQQAVEGYRSEIERLTNLRSRRTGGGGGNMLDANGSGGNQGGVGGQTMVQGQGNLPYNVVAIVALIAFILGVIIF